MSKSPKEQRERIILAVLVSMAVCAGIWFGALEPEQAGLRHQAKVLAETQGKLSTVQRELRLTESFKAHLDSNLRQIESMEAKMPTGDVYRWAIRSLTSLQTNNVEIANMEPPRISESSILPKVPYKAALYSVNGVAHYHDFGKFLANLENGFPHMRLQRLELEPVQFGEATSAGQEQLNFKLEVLALIKGSAGER
jgi:type II secretory pathway component PulM